MRLLGIDLGSSFIKGGVLDLDTHRIQSVERFPFPDPLPGHPPTFREFDPDTVIRTTRGLLDRLLSHAPDACGVVMCSQMHSLVLAARDGRPVSNVISWQDQRTLQPFRGTGRSYFEEVQSRLSPEERRDMGNEPRPGVPLCTLFWLKENGLIPADKPMAASLPGLVVSSLCGAPITSDLTQGHSYGALNVRTGQWHRPVIERLGLDAVTWPGLVGEGAVVGELTVGTRRIPVYAPVGDYQCAQVGAFLQDDDLSINVSTGSAVIRLARTIEFGDYQTRQWFDGRYLKTITHIPGGRALNALARLLSELAVAQGIALKDPWDYILAEASKVESTDLRIDPAFYFSATGDRGSFANVREENLTVGHVFRAALDGMADNYVRCSGRVAPTRDWKQLLFSGGVALKTPLLRKLISDRLNAPARTSSTEEDSVLGLLILALKFTGRMGSVMEAIAAVSRECGSPFRPGS